MAIFQEIREGRGTPGGRVWLDISHKDPEFIKERLPKLVDWFKEYAVDFTQEPVEVAPTSHYAMGGLKVNFETGETTVKGLFAAGESTAGVHGANRLGGNSLAETIVLGEIKAWKSYWNSRKKEKSQGRLNSWVCQRIGKRPVTFLSSLLRQRPFSGETYCVRNPGELIIERMSL